MLGASVLATAAYGLKQLTAPTLSSWWARWRGRPTAAEEAAAQKAEEAANAKVSLLLKSQWGHHVLGAANAAETQQPPVGAEGP